MRIFHITDHLPEYHHPWGGAEKVAYRHINILAEDKKYKLFVGATKPLKTIKEKFEFERTLTFEDFFPKKIHLYLTGIKNQIFPFDLIAFVSVLITVLKIKPDIIHIHKANKISFAPILVGKLLSIPVVLAIYDYWYFCPGAMLIDAEAHLCHRFHGRWCANCSATKKFGLAAQLSSLYRRSLFDWFYSMVNGFLVLSDFNVKLLVKYGIEREKIFVVRQVYNPPKEKIKNTIVKGEIYMNAWMAPHKGVHVVIQAFGDVVKKVPEAFLTLETKVLDSAYEQKIKKLIKRLKLTNKIEISERKTVEDYLLRIGRANVVVVAEQWENMAPTTLSDALSRGKPVVASNIGGLPEMLVDNKSGLLAVHNDPQDFADKIVKVINNPGLATKLGANAPLLVKNLGATSKIHKQLQALYSTLKR